MLLIVHLYALISPGSYSHNFVKSIELVNCMKCFIYLFPSWLLFTGQLSCLEILPMSRSLPSCRMVQSNRRWSTVWLPPPPQGQSGDSIILYYIILYNIILYYNISHIYSIMYHIILYFTILNYYWFIIYFSHLIILKSPSLIRFPYIVLHDCTVLTSNKFLIVDRKVLAR